ncbi:MAG TPA: hypothetical protein VJX67_06660 [Blastocatellia bacterium]|nr:hypothetical protein [Blastocatellia bacterium]
MALVSVVRRYNFSKAELDGSQWATLDESEFAKRTRLSGLLELLCPDSVVTASSFPEKKEDYQPLVNVFRWTLGLEGKTFDWPRYLGKEAINVQLIFDLYDRSVSLYEAFGTLESLSPTRPIPESPGRRFARSALRVLGAVAKESKIHVVDKVAPEMFSFAADSIPSEDNKDDTLWYLRRFYLDPEKYPVDSEPPRPGSENQENPLKSCKDPLGCSSYGIEWRITKRLIETVGSRVAGIAGILFFQGAEPGKANEPIVPPPIKVRVRFGLKPKSKNQDWLFYTWRPDCDPNPAYADHNSLDDARDLNSKPIVVDIGLSPASSSPLSSVIVKPWI